jgi:exonuclease III
MMKVIFWNVRGLNKPGRKLSLNSLISSNQVDFIGIQETKKEESPLAFLESVSTPVKFVWHVLPAIGTAGGILLGVREESLSVSNFSCFTFDASCQVYDRSVDLS